jgi:AcrR family transcriptional regulator
MEANRATPLSGRRAQAARNDVLILEAARTVFVADPGAPISAVAEQAGVGISAVYRRYENKEDLLRQLCADGLARYVAAAEAAAGESDPWTAFSEFMRRVVDADTHALTVKLAGTFEPTDELRRESTRANDLTVQLVERAQAAGVLRKDVQTEDLSCVFEQLSAVRLGDEARTRELRERYLALQLDALHGSSRGDLPGRAPSWRELSRRWERR